MVLLVLLTLDPAGRGDHGRWWWRWPWRSSLSLKFIHPVRTARWRAVNLPVTLAWVAFAGWSAWEHFAPPALCKAGLVATSAWILGVGMVMQVFPRRVEPAEAG